ncbi:hypothetical protein M0811_03790 [Anaeramoeba ignava]|uniref:CCHC-type domain-containing protein n=1 Tax=Anaeramoeba ignava TaxID=1746090 RepID=A0A9Q0LX12_ANAIG|nr:hypothetical protein M0811_03790 [Anaeramoeba ignava]
MAVCWFSDSVASSLFQANQIFIDGTFLSAAKPFTQLITIMCFDHSSRIYVPAVYAISTSSKQDMYTFIFENIFRYFLNSKWKFKYVTCDFEVSLQNAIKKVLPEAQLIGCFFHWKNAIRKKVNKLCSELDENQKKELVESLEELTYIPLNMIEEKLKKIKVHFKGCEEFFKYFQKIWMRKYSPQIWNISSFPDLSQRTNGPLEGYHKRLNRRIGHEKPKLIQMRTGHQEIPTDNEETTKWWEKVQKYRKEDEEKKDELRLSSQVRKKQGRKNSQDKKKRQSSQILEEQEENQIIQEEIENYLYRHSSFSDWSSEEDFDLSEERVSEHENGFEKKRHKNSEKKYCCSQCGKPGHNKVTCPKNGDKCLFVISELPKLSYLDSTKVTKEEKQKALKVGKFMKVVTAELTEEERNQIQNQMSKKETKVVEFNPKKKKSTKFGYSHYTYAGHRSEGNRFIRNKDL